MKKNTSILGALVCSLVLMTSCGGSVSNEQNKDQTQNTLKNNTSISQEGSNTSSKSEVLNETQQPKEEIVEKSFDYSLCEAEFGGCRQKCKVVLTKGEKVEIGSYVKVIYKGDTMTEGYILKHTSGSIFILKNKKDAGNPEICGGCCGEALEINIAKKEIWTC
jgi:hypothetical protein